MLCYGVKFYLITYAIYLPSKCHTITCLALIKKKKKSHVQPCTFYLALQNKIFTCLYILYMSPCSHMSPQGKLYVSYIHMSSQDRFYLLFFSFHMHMHIILFLNPNAKILVVLLMVMFNIKFKIALWGTFPTSDGFTYIYFIFKSFKMYKR